MLLLFPPFFKGMYLLVNSEGSFRILMAKLSSLSESDQSWSLSFKSDRLPYLPFLRFWIRLWDFFLCLFVNFPWLEKHREGLLNPESEIDPKDSGIFFAPYLFLVIASLSAPLKVSTKDELLLLSDTCSSCEMQTVSGMNFTFFYLPLLFSICLTNWFFRRTLATTLLRLSTSFTQSEK